MINVNLKTDFAKDVLIDLFLTGMDKDSVLDYFYPPTDFLYKYDWMIIESESGVYEGDWEEYDGDKKEAWCIIKFTEKNQARRSCLIKFYGYNRSHEGKYLEGIKEVNKVVKTIETYE